LIDVILFCMIDFLCDGIRPTSKSNTYTYIIFYFLYHSRYCAYKCARAS